MLRTLLIDNYDSYTYNLYQLLSDVNGVAPEVIRNDEVAWPDLLKRFYNKEFDNVVISPGPGTSVRDADVGVCRLVFRDLKHVPVLGVCLGLQALATTHGAVVSHAPYPVHGRLSAVYHDGKGLFAGIPSGEEFGVVRYHSLAVREETLPSCLVATAWATGVLPSQPSQQSSNHATPRARPRGRTCIQGDSSACKGAPSSPRDTCYSSRKQRTCGFRNTATIHAANGLGSQDSNASTSQELHVAHLSADDTGYASVPRVPLSYSRDGHQTASQAAARQCPSEYGSRAEHLRASDASCSCEKGRDDVRHGVTNGLPDLREPTASSPRDFGCHPENGIANGDAEPPVIMGLAHTTRPHVAVQFHPESVATAFGIAVLQNFKDMTLQYLALQPEPPLITRPKGLPGSSTPAAQWDGAIDSRDPTSEACSAAGPTALEVKWRQLSGMLMACGGSAAVFKALHGSNPSDDTFWLDSAATDRARFSFCGGRGGPLWQRITYFVAATGSGDGGLGTLHMEDSSGCSIIQTNSLWEYLNQELAARCCRMTQEAAAALPFDFWGGYVGYLGYGLRSESGAPSSDLSDSSPDLPDAALFLADRLVAMDHMTGDVFVVCLSESSSAAALQADEWLAATAAHLQELARTKQGNAGAQPLQPSLHLPAASEAPDTHGLMQKMQNGGTAVDMSSAAATAATPGGVSRHADTCRMKPQHSRQQYMDNVQQCLQALKDGESYELCLTTTFSGEVKCSAWECYQVLRGINPAPYGAWLSFGHGGPQVCCSSPERFLRGGRGRTLEAQPIKGTCKRSSDPATDAALAAALSASEKDRAENLMIVDLLRNDLGRTCMAGSVHVPSLMSVQSFATVHQLVSTIRGVRKADESVIGAIRAAFPGGSMTGAPKLRSMEILDRLEGRPRGVYSGCIGFIGFNGTFDLNIVIRSAVFHRGRVSVGAGGAVVIASDPLEEYEEMMLKAAPVLQSVGAVMSEPCH